jgi:Lipocalin-like domain
MLRTRMRCVVGWMCVTGLICLVQGQPPDSATKRLTGRSETASKLIGTWKLVAIEERDANGKRVVPLDYGSDPVGLLMYDATGHMSAQAMRRGRARLPSDDVHMATPEQAKAVFTGYNGYFGTYEVIENESIVIHHVEGSMIPNWEGGDQRRKFTLAGDKLILEPPPIQAGGAKHVRRLTWQRVR